MSLGNQDNGGVPSLISEGLANPPDERKEGEAYGYIHGFNPVMHPACCFGQPVLSGVSRPGQKEISRHYSQ